VEYIEPFSDERHLASCIHCGTQKTASFTRDHVPSKSLLARPLPDNVPTFDICGDCNNRLSRDEEYLKLVLACIFEGTCEPDEIKDDAVARALKRNGPMLGDLRRARCEPDTIGGERRVIWQPDLTRMLPPLIKNARGHFIYELGERADGDPASIGVCPLQSLDEATRAAFEAVSTGQVWPEVGSRMMTRMATGTGLSNGWIVVQPSVYRYAIHEFRAVRIVIREYLAFEAVWD
jgi:hypothetical protein